MKWKWYIYTILTIGIIAIAQSPPIQSFNIGNITGSVTLPLNASTETTQQQVLATLSSFAPGGTGTVKIQDGAGNPLTSQLNGTQQALDIGIDVAGVQVDPRTRAWALSSAGDSVTVPGVAQDTTLSSFSTQTHTDLTSINMTLGSPMQNSGGSVTANAGTNLNTSALNLEATQSAFKSTNHTDLSTINTTLGSPFQSGGTISNTTFASTQSGTWTVQQGSPPWSQNLTQISGATPSVTNYIPARITNGTSYVDPTQIRALNSGTDSVTATCSVPGTVAVTQSTNPWIINGNATVTNAGTFAVQAAQSGIWTVQQGSPPWAVSQSGSWTVTANAGTNLNTSALALDTSVTGLQVSQGSTTSGQHGTMIQGAVTTSPPSYITGQTSPLSLTTSGALRVDGTSTTQPISGTVTANQGGAPWSVSQSGTWTVQPGNTANTTPWLVTVATSLPAGSNTIGAVTQASGPWTQNITQFGGTNLATGTGASGAGIPRVTVSNDSNILATQSGTWNINNVSGTISLPTGASTSTNQTNGTQKTQIVDGGGAVYGPTTTLSAVNYLPVVQASSGTPGAAVPARSTVIAGSDGTNTQTISTDTTGKININNISGTISLPTGAATAAGVSATQPRNITQFGGTNISTGTGASGAGIPRVTVANDSNILATQSGSWTVTANAGTNLNTSALALDASVNGLLVSQASTTSGQKGPLIQGAVTAAAPTYTTAQTSPLSLKTTGELRVADAAAESSLAQIVTNTSTANSDTLVNGNITAVCTDANINACTAGSTVSISAFGIYTVTASITGTWVATLVVDGQYADNTWGRIGVLVDGTTYAQINQFTSNAKLVVQSGGYQNIRVRANAFTSGTAAIGLEASIAQKSVLAITIPNVWNVTHITGAATTTIKTGPGVLHSININNGNAGSTSVFLNTTGTGSSIAVVANTSETPFPFDVPFVTGLTIVTTNATTDVTVFYQ